MQLFTADCGKSEAHIYNSSTDEYRVITHQDLMHLNIPTLQVGDTLVIEGVHLRPRENNSLAQPYTYEQLLELKQRMSERQIKILLFPNETTPKVRGLSGLEKTDENDVRAIGHYLHTFPHIVDGLQEFEPISTEQHIESHQSIWDDRDELSMDVNIARNVGYGFDSDDKDGITKWILRNALKLHELLGPELAECVGITVNKRNGKLNKIKSPSRIYTVAATLLRPQLTPEGFLRLRLRSDTGELPEWKYVKKYFFCLSPNHRRGGVVASNYKHHMRPAISGVKGRIYVNSEEECRELAIARTCADKKLQIIWTTMRNLILEQCTHSA